MNSKIARLIIKEVEANGIEEKIKILLLKNWKEEFIEESQTSGPYFGAIWQQFAKS